MSFMMLAALLAATPAAALPPPIPRHDGVIQGTPARFDPYAWLRDDSRSRPDLLALLEAQNAWSEAVLAGQQPLEARLRQEFDARPRGDAASESWVTRAGHAWRLAPDGSLWRKGEAHPVLPARSAEGYYEAGGWSLSPDGRLLAIAEDRRGSRDYRVSVLRLEDGQVLAELTGRSSDLAWADDGQTLYTIGNERRTLRPYRLLAWHGGQEKALWQERDPAWLVSLYRTTDDRFLLLQSNNHDSSEQYLLEGSRAPHLLQGRRAGVEYYADHQSGWVIRSNRDGAFALYGAEQPDRRWLRLWQPPAGATMEKWRLFERHLVVQLRHAGQDEVALLDRQGNERHRLPLSGSAGTGWLQGAQDPAADRILVRSQSLSTPPRERWLDLNEGRWSAPLEDTTTAYRSERRWITSADGTRVPVSLAWREGVTPRAVLLYGYGAYGTPMRPYYQREVLSLLDRGVLYAIVHVRGGGLLGEEWTQAGRGIHKQRGIDDFLAAADTLGQQGRLPVLAMGGSAGGLLVGAALNQAPTHFAAAVLQVPFLDPIATMMDPELPLTRQEYQEWGNPALPAEYAALRRISPYDNLARRPYPPVLVSTALYDSQVPYWEPLKWMARLREQSTSQGPYLLLTELEGGHRAGGGDRARELAFLLTQVGLNDSGEQP
ncbi:protease II [Aeromonas diversa CDC 2478-85]|uniref:Protease II n=1 Tax=Aeromonas diversa CDC 2478-85 TaxID=1268237 RepID=N9U4N0_9GAMM|nr:prolyl oligopeptidase family serine peptidase [Aeromonas diversa]ENY73345.1 protease II [Aeromonas diversa CDC 2478-85]